MKPLQTLILLISLGLLAAACGSSEGVSRIDVEDDIDLTGSWNERDARMVSDALMTDVLAHHWLETFEEENSDTPIIIVGTVRNESMEHIDTEVITNALETELINTRRIDFVADPETREQIRDERLDQQRHADPESAAQLASETGADYMLNGSINAIYDESERGDMQTVFYSVSLQLTDLESNQIVWRGTEEIRKLVERSSVRM